MYLPEKNMADQKATKKVNPLAQYFRQPKLFIRLPSEGRFYPEGSLDISANGEYPVYAMTAKDELLFKTPDALLTGQSTVEVIKSCVPAILDPWKMPTLDVDVVLMSIRIATYGEMMEITSNCPACNNENNFEIDVNKWLAMISKVEYESVISFDPLTIHIRPYTYQEITKTKLKQFEQQRIFAVINDENMKDEDKLTLFNESFIKLSELTVDIVAGCIDHIDTPDGTVDDKDMINEFVNNASKELFDVISTHVTEMKTKNELKPIDAICQGCSEEYVIPITMDQSDFFGQRSQGSRNLRSMKKPNNLNAKAE